MDNTHSDLGHRHDNKRVGYNPKHRVPLSQPYGDRGHDHYDGCRWPDKHNLDSDAERDASRR